MTVINWINKYLATGNISTDNEGGKYHGYINLLYWLRDT